MESALAWIGQIASWIGQWIPRWVIVATTHGAVKFVRGKKVIALGPGIHFYWPVLTEFVQYPTARQGCDLKSQTIVTLDDKTIVVGGLLVYEVTDIEQLIAYTHSPDGTIQDISLTAIHDVCCQQAWSDLAQSQRSGALDKALRKAIQDELKSYGVKVLKAMLTDLAPVRVYKLIQSTSSDS